MKMFADSRLARAALVVFTVFIVLRGAGGGLAAPGDRDILFTILHTNDEHSVLVPVPLVDYSPLEPNPARGGFGRLAGAVAEIRAAKLLDNEPVLLISAGDFLGGSPYSWLALAGHAPELALMIELSYDVVTLGNHEFDYGAEVLAGYLAAAGYPDSARQTAIVSSNTRPPEGHPLGRMGIRDTFIKELDNGLRIGFFGLMGQDAAQVSPFAEPVIFTDQHPAAAEAVAALRRERADIIVGVTHQGVAEDRSLARAVPGIDVIVGGHSHSALEDPLLEGGTIIVQAGSQLHYLGILELAYEPATGQLRVRNRDSGQAHLAALDNSVPEEPGIISLIDYYTGELNRLINRMTEGRFNAVSDLAACSDFAVPIEHGREAPMGNFVTDAMRLAAGEALGERVDLAIHASGPIRGGITPGRMPYSDGKISFYDLADLTGLGTGPDGDPGFPVVAAYFTAAEVRKILEISVFLSEYMGGDYFLQVSGLRAAYDRRRAMIRLPLIGLPLPTSRAVLSVEMYAGDGIQGGDEDAYEPLAGGTERLYLVAADYAIAAALPLVGEMVPYYLLEPKDAAGRPAALADRIVYRNGRELKVWQAVVEYAARQPVDDEGNPRIDAVYAAAGGRLVEVRGTPLWLWPAAALPAIALLIILVKRQRRKAETKAGREA